MEFEGRWRRLFPREPVEFVKLGLQERFIRQAGLVLGDKRGRHGPTEEEFNQIGVLEDRLGVGVQFSQRC